MSQTIAIPAADGQIGLVPKTSDITAGTGTGTTAPAEGKVDAYMGIAAATSSGTAVILQLFDSTAASGTLVEEVVIPASGGVDYEITNPDRLGTGLFLHYVSGAGTVTGVIRVG